MLYYSYIKLYHSLSHHTPHVPSVWYILTFHFSSFQVSNKKKLYVLYEKNNVNMFWKLSTFPQTTENRKC